eukprot:363063-Chlamydomonas_euryale.AAC.6
MYFYAAPEEVIGTICAVPERPGCPHMLNQTQHVRSSPTGPGHVATVSQRISWDHEEACLPGVLRADDFIRQLQSGRASTSVCQHAHHMNCTRLCPAHKNRRSPALTKSACQPRRSDAGELAAATAAWLGAHRRRCGLTVSRSQARPKKPGRHLQNPTTHSPRPEHSLKQMECASPQCGPWNPA